MNNKDFVFEQMKEEYLEADFQYRIKGITSFELNQKVVEILIVLLDSYSGLYPYYQVMQDEAEKRWKEATKNQPVRGERKIENNEKSYFNKILENLENEFIQENFLYKQGKISMFEHNSFLGRFLQILLDQAGEIQPYFRELEKRAEAKWKQSPEFKKYILSQL